MNIKQIIEVSQARGCWRAQEMSEIGKSYNTLCNILKELGELQKTQEQQVPETGDSGNTSNTESVVDGAGNKVLNI